LKGLVLEEGGKAPEWARVEVRDGAVIASSDVTPDGHFFIDGLSAGKATVHAFNDKSEAQREVMIEANRETEVHLDLRGRSRARIHLTAFGASGAPVRAARLFLLYDGALTSSDADGAGSASFLIPSTSTACFAAAFSPTEGWAFDGPLSIRSDPEPAEVPIRFSSRAVTLSIESGHATPVAISCGNGFPLERLFPFIGWPSMAAPLQPLRVRGLPVGLYRVTAGSGLARTVSVDGTKDLTISF